MTNFLIDQNSKHLANDEYKHHFEKYDKMFIVGTDLKQREYDEAMKIVADKLSVQGSEGTEAVWNDSEYVAKLDQSILTIFEQEAQWFIDNGMFSTPMPDFNKIIFSDYLKTVNPDSVSIMDDSP